MISGGGHFVVSVSDQAKLKAMLHRELSNPPALTLTLPITLSDSDLALLRDMLTVKSYPVTDANRGDMDRLERDGLVYRAYPEAAWAFSTRLAERVVTG